MSADATRRATPRARYAENIYFQDGNAVTAILVALLYLLLAMSLDAAGYVRDLAVLLPVTLGAFVLGFLMSPAASTASSRCRTACSRAWRGFSF